MKEIIIKIDIDGCKFCREDGIDILEEASGDRKYRNNKPMDIFYHPRIPHGKVLVINPDYNAPSPGRKHGVLTHYHIFIMDRDDLELKDQVKELKALLVDVRHSLMGDEITRRRMLAKLERKVK